jgi:iron complex transport system substrate-binding protein
MRLVSICPSNTEIACALGAVGALVGLDRSSDWPPEVRALPRVGPDLEVDVDAIVALKPDLVLSSLSVPGMERNLERLDRAGVPHLVLDATSIEGVYLSIRTLGRALGAEAGAEVLVASLGSRLAAVEARAAALPRRARIFLEWWPKPVITPGRRCWTTDMMRIAGGENVFADIDARSQPIEDHRVPEREPDLLLTCWCGVPHDRQKPERMAGRPGWAELPAVRAGRLYAAQECWFGRPGPRLVEGVEWLHGLVAAWAREDACA